MNQIIALLFLLLATGCNMQPKETAATIVQSSHVNAVRYGMITGVKPEKLDYYKQLHAKPWPQVLNKIKECNIQNYSIYLQKIGEQNFLFSYFEYTGNDFGKDMQKMAADSVTQRWWRETDPCQLPLQEALEKHEIWTSMQEVFHAD
jgi:L-rhamnose mutarotase